MRVHLNGRTVREGARYAMRALRVGEAAHPGPQSAMTRRRGRPRRQNHVPEDVLNALELDLSRDDSVPTVRESRFPRTSRGDPVDISSDGGFRFHRLRGTHRPQCQQVLDCFSSWGCHTLFRRLSLCQPSGTVVLSSQSKLGLQSSTANQNVVLSFRERCVGGGSF